MRMSVDKLMIEKMNEKYNLNLTYKDFTTFYSDEVVTARKEAKKRRLELDGNEIKFVFDREKKDYFLVHPVTGEFVHSIPLKTDITGQIILKETEKAIKNFFQNL